MDDTKHLKGLIKIVKHYKVLAVLFGVIALIGILMATTLIMCQIQYDVPYDGKNVTLERRGSGYYLVYHGKGSIGYSASADTDSSEYYISFNQTAYSRLIWPLYHNNEGTMWFCEAGKITKLSTQDGKVIWEAGEAELKEHEQWLLDHKLFMKEAEQVPFRAMPASIKALSASVQASQAGAGIKAATTAAKTGAEIMKSNIITGVIAAVVSAGITTGIVLGVVSKTNKSKLPETTIDITTIAETTTAEETTAAAETTTEETTTSEETTSSEETATTEETTSESTTAATTKKTTKKSSVPSVPKGYKKLYWGKKFEGHKVYLVYKYGKGTISYKGYWKGSWVNLDYDEASDDYQGWSIQSGKDKYKMYYEVGN